MSNDIKLNKTALIVTLSATLIIAGTCFPSLFTELQAEAIITVGLLGLAGAYIRKEYVKFINRTQS